MEERGGEGSSLSYPGEPAYTPTLRPLNLHTLTHPPMDVPPGLNLSNAFYHARVLQRDRLKKDFYVTDTLLNTGRQRPCQSGEGGKEAWEAREGGRRGRLAGRMRLRLQEAAIQPAGERDGRREDRRPPRSRRSVEMRGAGRHSPYTAMEAPPGQ
ncbi:hypothetical protein E2C01_063104 [Portunus trituberculatus]|uniref:Uncharacterized protein n=1 Tax=Portunus trituberculatus TaxID=210409 RepID=A0A5B7HFH0_PORTR|nr:hypothetical protein [Portunus trituberculatus]